MSIRLINCNKIQHHYFKIPMLCTSCQNFRDKNSLPEQLIKKYLMLHGMYQLLFCSNSKKDTCMHTGREHAGVFVHEQSTYLDTVVMYIIFEFFNIMLSDSCNIQQILRFGILNGASVISNQMNLPRSNQLYS